MARQRWCPSHDNLHFASQVPGRNSLGAIFRDDVEVVPYAHKFKECPLPYRASLSCPGGCVLLPTAYHSMTVVGATIVLRRLRHKSHGRRDFAQQHFSKICSVLYEFSTTQPRGRPRHCRAASDNLPRRRVVFNWVKPPLKHLKKESITSW